MADIQQVILGHCRSKWLKVARIVWFTHNELSLPDDDQSYAMVEREIRSMIDSGLLESSGNLSNWRESEVRLKISNIDVSS